MRALLAAAVLAASFAGPAFAGEVEQVPHGLVVTTDAGEKVRLLAFADGTIRVTVAEDLAAVSPSLMVNREADGAPVFQTDGTYASLTTHRGHAMVQLSDGRLTVYDAAGSVLLDEHAPARRMQPVNVEGQRWLATRVQFNRGTDEGLYGLGQHQNRQMNYNGQDVELAQHNMAIAIPYMVSTRGYGILWDNNSITRVGDPAPYRPLELDWRADYYLDRRFALSRREATINYQYIRDQARWPTEALSRTEAATSGQNTAGNAVQSQAVIWSGRFRASKAGTHKFRLYSSSYVRVLANGREVLNRWRQNWNPWYHHFELDLRAGERVDLRIEWEPNAGYIALEHAEPLPAADRHSVSFASDAGTAIDYYVVPAPTMDEGIAGYRRLTGKAPMMPRWSYGFWQSRQRYQTQEELTQALGWYRALDIPIDAIVQDWFYWPEDQWGCHCFDPVRFPDPAAMVRSVHANNARIMISVWPKFYPNTTNAQELAAGGFLYQRPLEAGQRDWVGPGYANTFYDPYSGEARAIYARQMIEALAPLGFDAWWMDATEPDWHSNLSVEERAYQMRSPVTGTPGLAIFNSYPLVHAEGVADALRAAQPNRRPFILTRSGFGGVQRASAALWSGDVAARWDDLRDQISAGTNLSVAGVPNWTHDIGGFSVESRYTYQLPEHLPEWRELYLRWFQYGAFSPLFRSHGEFPLRETPVIASQDEAMLEGLTYYHRLRYRLLPYIYTLAAGTHFDDGTILRPLVMDFEADRRVWEIDDQYLFGPSIMVAPVTQFGARERQVYLPAGTDWYDAQTGTRHAGGQTITVDAPRERIPLFIRAGAIIPLGPVVQHANENPQGPLVVHVFAGADGSFSLYEDQGEDMGHARGEFSRIPMRWFDRSRTFTLGARQGSFPGMEDLREIAVIVHDGSTSSPVFEAEEPGGLLYHGEPIP